MARTPLLRSLQRLAREHQAAGRLGIAPTEFRERQAEAHERSYSRGEFLKRSGAVGAAVALGGPAALASGRAPRTGRASSIVGGGIAGLTAALTLQDKGVSSTIYESLGPRRRPDALRLDRVRSASGQTASRRELCGELIDSEPQDDPAACAAVRPRDGRPARARSRTGRRTPTGSSAPYYPRTRRTRTSDRSTSTLQGRPGDGLPDALQPVHGRRESARQDERVRLDRDARSGRPRLAVRHVARQRLQRGIRRRNDRPVGAEPRSTCSATSRSPGNFSIFGASDERYHIVGGNTLLPQAIASALPRGACTWATAMKSIATNADGTIAIDVSTP